MGLLREELEADLKHYGGYLEPGPDRFNGYFICKARRRPNVVGTRRRGVRVAESLKKRRMRGSQRG